MKYNYIDLFSGAGGMSLGFDLEGFKMYFQSNMIFKQLKHTDIIFRIMF